MGALNSVMPGRGLTLADKGDNSIVTANTKPFRQEVYDISLAVVLAGYTFEVYLKPVSLCCRCGAKV